MHTTKNSKVLLQARKLIEVARNAPSVHNTQPWHFRLHNDTLYLFVDNTRRLRAGDPTKRELWLSIGIIFETIIQSAAALGIIIKVKELQTDSLKHPIATIVISSQTQGSQDENAVAIIQNRRTYRGELSKKPIEPSALKSLQDITKDHRLKDVEIIVNHAIYHLTGSMLVVRMHS